MSKSTYDDLPDMLFSSPSRLSGLSKGVSYVPGSVFSVQPKLEDLGTGSGKTFTVGISQSEGWSDRREIGIQLEPMFPTVSRSLQTSLPALSRRGSEMLSSSNGIIARENHAEDQALSGEVAILEDEWEGGHANNTRESDIGRPHEEVTAVHRSREQTKSKLISMKHYKEIAMSPVKQYAERSNQESIRDQSSSEHATYSDDVESISQRSSRDEVDIRVRIPANREEGSVESEEIYSDDVENKSRDEVDNTERIPFRHEEESLDSEATYSDDVTDDLQRSGEREEIELRIPPRLEEVANVDHDSRQSRVKEVPTKKLPALRGVAVMGEETYNDDSATGSRQSQRIPTATVTDIRQRIPAATVTDIRQRIPIATVENDSQRPPDEEDNTKRFTSTRDKVAPESKQIYSHKVTDDSQRSPDKADLGQRVPARRDKVSERDWTMNKDGLNREANPDTEVGREPLVKGTRGSLRSRGEGAKEKKQQQVWSQYKMTDETRKMDGIVTSQETYSSQAAQLDDFRSRTRLELDILRDQVEGRLPRPQSEAFIAEAQRLIVKLSEALEEEKVSTQLMRHEITRLRSVIDQIRISNDVEDVGSKLSQTERLIDYAENQKRRADFFSAASLSSPKAADDRGISLRSLMEELQRPKDRIEYQPISPRTICIATACSPPTSPRSVCQCAHTASYQREDTWKERLQKEQDRQWKKIMSQRLT